VYSIVETNRQHLPQDLSSETYQINIVTMYDNKKKEEKGNLCKPTPKPDQGSTN
jgi:hypothetical protein